MTIVRQKVKSLVQIASIAILQASTSCGYGANGVDEGPVDESADGGALDDKVLGACPTFDAPTSLGRVQSSAINESSGSASSRVHPGVLWTHNDSGDSSRIFALTESGILAATVNINNASARDWEDMATGPGPGGAYIYIADIGDNGKSRGSYQIYRIPEPNVSASDRSRTLSVSAEVMTFKYPNGSHNSETLLVDPKTGELAVVLKGDGTVVYSLGQFTTGTRTAVQIGQINQSKGGVDTATGGDVSADGSSIAVRDYYEGRLWRRPAGGTLADALSGTPCTIPIASGGGGEGLAFAANGTGYFTLNEGLNNPIYFARLRSSDQCPSDPNKTEPGQCGCGVPEGTCSSTPPCQATLSSGARLQLGQTLCSPNGGTKLGMSSDGNLALRSGSTVTWQTNTHGTFTAMQGDGNLVVYNDSTPVFSSNTQGHSGASLSVLDDGRVVIRYQGNVIWSQGAGADGCPNDPNKIEPGQCGCGIPEGSCSPTTSKLNKHVFVITFENHDAGSIYGNTTQAPYINGTLMPKYARASKFMDTLPGLVSQPHYMLMEAGRNDFSDHTFTNDAAPSASNSTSSTRHLVTQIKDATNGVTWRSYQEGLNSSTGACPIASSGFYAPKHNPFVYFQDVAGNPPSKTNAYCVAHHKPLTALASDLANGSVASYNFVTPDLCNDMHGASGCPSGDPIRLGDNWLRANLPAIINYVNAKGGVIFLVWDEGEGSTTIPFLAIGPTVKPGYVSGVTYNHASLVKSAERILGLPTLNTAEVLNATDFADMFVTGGYPN